MDLRRKQTPKARTNNNLDVQYKTISRFSTHWGFSKYPHRPFAFAIQVCF